MRWLCYLAYNSCSLYLDESISFLSTQALPLLLELKKLIRGKVISSALYYVRKQPSKGLKCHLAAAGQSTVVETGSS